MAKRRAYTRNRIPVSHYEENEKRVAMKFDLPCGHGATWAYDRPGICEDCEERLEKLRNRQDYNERKKARQ